jgi:transposase-like protein
MSKQRAQLYSVAELAERFGIKRSTLYYWARIGRLKPMHPPPEPLLFTLSALRTAIRQAQAKQPLGWYLKLRQVPQ